MKKKISEITANFTFFDEKTDELKKGEIVLYGVPEKKVKKVNLFGLITTLNKVFTLLTLQRPVV